MAAEFEETSTNMNTENDQNKQDKSTVFGWIFEYCCHIFWEEFRETFTVDAASERRLLEGIPMYAVESKHPRKLLAHFVSLLTRLADGCDHDTEYDDAEGNITPLEGALLLLLELVNDMEQNEQLEAAICSLELNIKTEAVLVCCRADDYDKAVEVFDRLWTGQKNLTAKEKSMKSKLDKVLQTQSMKHVPSCNTWENFQKTVVDGLMVVYENMHVDLPFLHKASHKFRDTRKRKASIQSESRRSSRTTNRLISCERLLAAGKELGCIDLENDQWDPSDVMKELSDVRKTTRKRSRRTQPPVSPIQADQDENQDMSDDNMVTSTPHSTSSTKHSSAKEKDRTKEKDRETWKDRPSCSTWKDQIDEQGDSKDRQTKNVDNKENNSPPRGKRIRDHQYQPGRPRVTSTRTLPNRNANSNHSYIDWSSDDDEDEAKNIFSAQLPHLKARKSLDLEDQPIRNHLIRRPAQRVPWTSDEEEKLRQGVAKYGKGNWAVIKDKYGFVIRTSVNLKDKWRNMEKVK